MPNETDLLLTELRKAIKVEPGDYIVIFGEDALSQAQRWQLSAIAEELWKQNIRLHAVEALNPSDIRFVKVESPETIQVEEVLDATRCPEHSWFNRRQQCLLPPNHPGEHRFVEEP